MAIKFRAILWFVLALAMLGYLALLLQSNSLNIDSNVLSLLPQTEADPAVERAFTSFSDQSMKNLVFLVRSDDKATAIAAADELGSALQSSARFASVQWNDSSTQQQAQGSFYFEHRHQLLSRADQQLLEAGNYLSFSDDSITLALAPFSGSLLPLLQQDPFLLSLRTGSANAARGSGNLVLENGYLVASRDGTHQVLVRAQLVDTPFAREVQEDVEATLSALENRWAAEDKAVQLLRMGAVFHAAYAFETAKGEMTLIGTCSFLLIVVLLVLTFRSPWPVAMVSIALGFGVAAGFVSVRLWFGEVHLLTLVFGSSLIGVAEDYAFHYFVIDDESSGERRMAHILPAISIGLLTSILGYAVLLLTPFPGFQQMALFCIAGLTGAFVTVVWLFPFVRLNNQNSRMMLNFCERLLQLFGAQSLRRLYYASCLLLLAAPLYLYLHGSTVDDVRTFQTQDVKLLAQQEVIDEVLAIPSANQFYLVRAQTPEQLLEKLESVRAELDALVAEGAIAAYVNLSDFLPTAASQASNRALIETLYQSPAATALVDSGLITAEQMDALRNDLAAGRDDYLQPASWLASPVGKELGYLWQKLEAGEAGAEEYTALIALNGIRDLTQMQDILVGGEVKAVFVDKISTVNTLLAAYRGNLSTLLWITFASTFLVLLWRYDLRKALLISSSPAIAIAATMLLMAALDEPVSLFSIISLFLVIGIGIDFGIFFAEEGELDRSVLLAVLLSGLTTIFSFGMLSLSQTSVIHSFGLSMLIGISISLALAPVIGHLLVKHRKPLHEPRGLGNE